MEKHQLSKSTFMRGVQCLKSLYLYKNRYFLRDKLSAEQLAKFKRGTDVGVFAQNLFPGGVDCKPKSPSQYRKSVEMTADIIAQNKAEVIYEAAFQFNGVLILLDILVKNGNTWDAYEVKSSLKVSDTFLLDAALQYYVLSNVGVGVNSFFLVHLNPDYVRGNVLEIKDLFKLVDLTDEVKHKQDYIANQIVAEKEALILKNSPKIDIGSHCHKPYPCDFLGHCWKHIPVNSVFNLILWSDEEKFELYLKGILKIEDIPAEMADTEEKKHELQAYKSEESYFDKQRFDQIFETIGKNFVYISLLTLKQAIPQWPGYGTYSHVPVCIGAMNHQMSPVNFFINQNCSRQPDDEFIRFLADHLKACDRLLIYDGENFLSLLKEMISRDHQHSGILKELLDKVVDLKDIFRQVIYLSPQTGNDFSLHNVGQRLLKVNQSADLSAERETEIVNLFLNRQKLKEESVSLQRNYIENYLQTTAKLHHHFLQARAEINPE